MDSVALSASLNVVCCIYTRRRHAHTRQLPKACASVRERFHSLLCCFREASSSAKKNFFLLRNMCSLRTSFYVLSLCKNLCSLEYQELSVSFCFFIIIIPFRRCHPQRAEHHDQETSMNQEETGIQCFHGVTRSSSIKIPFVSKIFSKIRLPLEHAINDE